MDANCRKAGGGGGGGSMKRCITRWHVSEESENGQPFRKRIFPRVKCDIIRVRIDVISRGIGFEKLSLGRRPILLSNRVDEWVRQRFRFLGTLTGSLRWQIHGFMMRRGTRGETCGLFTVSCVYIYLYTYNIYIYRYRRGSRKFSFFFFLVICNNRRCDVTRIESVLRQPHKIGQYRSGGKEIFRKLVRRIEVCTEHGLLYRRPIPESTLSVLVKKFHVVGRPSVRQK